MASSVLVDKGNNSKVTAKLIEYFLKLDSTKLLDSSTHNNNNNNNWPPDIDRTQLASAYCNICTGILQFPTWEMPTEPTCSLYCYWRVQSQLTVLERWCEPSVIINEQGWPPQLAITVFLWYRASFGQRGLPHSFLSQIPSHGFGGPVAMEQTLAKGALCLESDSCWN